MKAKWHGAPYHDYTTKKWLVSFECEQPPEVYDETKDDLISLEVKKFRNKRSLNANAYFHVLTDKLAEKMRVSHTEMHNELIADYGQVDEELGCVILKDSIPWKRLETIHVRPTHSTRVLDDGELYRCYEIMRGSHTYDTKEMSHLIDGTVDEAKKQGIETLPPEDLERMVNAWKV